MKVNVLIIGAGITGLSIAYHLAKKGTKGVHVIDQGYFLNGATGRCGAGVRSQWSTKLNCLLAKKSIDFFKQAADLLNYADDLEFKQEGYLLLSHSKDEHDQFEKNVKLQNSLDIPSVLLSKKEALALVPYLNTKSFYGAAFCQIDGHLNPFKTSEAFYLEAKRLGVTFSFFEEALQIETIHRRIVSVQTSKTIYQTSKVVVAAGAHSKEIGKLVDVNIPVYAENHEILATEPVEPILGPMVMSFSKNMYCQQVPHGPFLMGRSDPHVKIGYDVSSSHHFLLEMSKTVLSILPNLGNMRVVRQWGGLYDMSPDRQPILSDTPQLEGFYTACGFSGHGFMIAPMTGLLMSELILKEKPSLNLEALHLNRFEKNEHIAYEHAVV